MTAESMLVNTWSHRRAIDRRDDGPGLDGDDEGHVVDEDDGLA
jgi:hypothetical protein